MNTLLKCTRVYISRECCKRYLSLQLEQLHQRSIVKLHGQDALPFLQGLITNDANHLSVNGCAIFTNFLDTKGRILYDSLLYRCSEKEILIECDNSVTSDLIKHLNVYRVRKKVNVEPFDGVVWNIFDDFNIPLSFKESISNVPLLLPRNDIHYKNIELILRDKNVIAFQDPRVIALGVRIITRKSSENPVKLLAECDIDCIESNNYTILRYKFGVPEGVTELPVGKCLPLEANCDYLHGVSFHKGCYIGQELTARIHHTGVVRKRIMPLILSSVPDREFENDEIIVNEEDKVVGKLRGLYKNYAIALLRVSETLEYVSNLKLNGTTAFTYRPFWWPQKLKDDSSKYTSS